MITEHQAIRQRYKQLGVDVEAMDRELVGLMSKDKEAKKMLKEYFGMWRYYLSVNYRMISALAADLYYKNEIKKDLGDYRWTI